MHRIDGAGHADHMFVAEDPTANRPPTEITAEIMNAFQEELATFIEWAGLVLAKGDNTQLKQALQAAFLTASSLDAHREEADPHPVYLTGAEGDVKIAAAVAALVASAPDALNVLGELAAALGNDPNFATTMTNVLALKASIVAIQQQAYTTFTTGGAAPNFTLTPTPALASYGAGADSARPRFNVKFHANGTTGNNTINISGHGDRSLKQYSSAGVKVAAIIAANQLADLEDDGVDMLILNPLPVAGVTVVASGNLGNPSANTRYQFSHGFGATPDLVFAKLRCTAVDQAYQVGDVMETWENGATRIFGSLSSDATIVNFSADSNPSPQVVNKTAPAGWATINAASWQVFLLAMKK